MQNESFPNFSNFRPEFCPEFCSEFSPNFSRTFRVSFRGRRSPEKIHQKSPQFFNAKFPGKHENLFTKFFWRAGKVTFDFRWRVRLRKENCAFTKAASTAAWRQGENAGPRLFGFIFCRCPPPRIFVPLFRAQHDPLTQNYYLRKNYSEILIIEKLRISYVIP